MRKPDLVSSKTLQRLGGWLICEIYLNTYFQRARLGGRLICELGLYASIYGNYRALLSAIYSIRFFANLTGMPSSYRTLRRDLPRYKFAGVSQYVSRSICWLVFCLFIARVEDFRVS